MTKCPRCGGSVLSEPFEDAQGSGTAAICASCGHTVETYTKLRTGALTAAQLRDLAEPSRRGRPRKAEG